MRLDPALMTAAAALAGALVAAGVSFMAARYAFRSKMVEMGVNILSTDPDSSDVMPARQSAIELIEEHAGKRFSDDDRAKLLHHVLLRGEIPSTASMKGTMGVAPRSD